MTMLSRRAFALAAPALSLAAAATLPAGSALAAPPAAANAMPPLAQMSIGRFKVTALTDGFADMPFSYFVGRTPKEIEAAAAGQFAARPGGIRLVFNQYLIEDGDRRMLIDTGPAGLLGESGKLPSALKAVGLAPENIDAVIITHMHRDHIGGLVAGGRRAFPNAEVYVGRREVAHWTDPAQRSTAPDFLKSSFDASAEFVRLYPKLQAIDGERSIVPGVSIIDLAGHTPGHIGVRIEDGGKSMLMVGDMLFHPSLHPVAADIGFIFEQDPEAARAMRARFFPRAAEEKALIAATHMPFPGLGRIVSDQGRLRWLAAEWAHQA
ncbi:MBL fold metallo-hydrolase [uncultured Bosea sp.]|jgi:glyoxylase-like metal-dependent hydrolase (beta-lactamase superfamily II)|uniref:MBL fold metallo-hydrolase n=1 Tax=uncultured Bosea sp. TaxID=211457 RepID=UPI0025F8E224|nr:MBL fold metallo-hydrolase [uncultured Bosea sp.]